MGPLKTKLSMRHEAIGTMLSELQTPNIARMLAASGFDFMIVDCEHGPFAYEAVSNLIAAARGGGISVLVRIPGVMRECILKYMDMGADGLVVPMVSGADTIAQAVSYAKYAPAGSRGVSTQRAHAGYSVDDLRVYMEAANAETVVFAQIETVEGLANAEDIAGTDGVDGLLLGPNDLLQELGVPGCYNDPRLAAAVGRVAEAAAAAGRCSGVITARADLIRLGREAGMRVISWNSEVGMLMQAAREGVARLRG
ncbi:HpcH/HpaI aldolase family protein [Paenibacillus koleovorans]|uniref:HpcH/HpaI aldolase family protein n=1 Tax=Paenibacillus koleovorans TaxID=121608 RepID=UPI000FD80BAE|nr:aldolase/citrate lyase family protein [Paenibacillus koleovorans]